MIAPTLLVLLLSVATAIAVVSHGDWAAQDRIHVLAPPGALHPAGTDSLGRDRLQRMAMATVLSFGLSTAAAVSSVAIAAILGAWIGSVRRRTRSVALLTLDVLLCLPLLFLFMLVRSVLPLNLTSLHSAYITFALLGVLSWPMAARLTAARSVEASQSLWLLQARAAGIRQSRVLRFYFIPYLWPLLCAEFLTLLPVFLAAEANLGILGLGIGEPLPSWGGMLRELSNSAMLSLSAWSCLPLLVLFALLGLVQIISLRHEVAA